MNENDVRRPESVAPRVRRLTAPNPSAFTFTGTQTYIVGEGRVAIIDPGPAEPAHVAALIDATKGEQIAAILCTHTHRDHSPASRALAAATGAQIIGCAPLAPASTGTGFDDAFDGEYAPDRVLCDGEAVAGNGWTLVAVATPGHASNHLCFALPQSNLLFSGDHVMGWSTSIVSPPDGDMGGYMGSLAKLIDREESLYLPGHGPAIESPRKLVRGLLGHRKQREGQILRLLAADVFDIPSMVARMYVGVDPGLHPAAERSVLAHLLDLASQGRVRREGDGWRPG